MNKPAAEVSSGKGTSVDVPRGDWEAFLQVFTHELRNRLNGIALEAADLAEQAGPQADATRLQQQVRDCSFFLKQMRETLMPEDPEGEAMAVGDFVKKLREKSL